jgi:hypothetical protein
MSYSGVLLRTSFVDIHFTAIPINQVSHHFSGSALPHCFRSGKDSGGIEPIVRMLKDVSTFLKLELMETFITVTYTYICTAILCVGVRSYNNAWRVSPGDTSDATARDERLFRKATSARSVWGLRHKGRARDRGWGVGCLRSQTNWDHEALSVAVFVALLKADDAIFDGSRKDKCQPIGNYIHWMSHLDRCRTEDVSVAPFKDPCRHIGGTG